VRLVLGHGGAERPPRALMPPEILVVTFTDAATQELRDRIRTRLADAADVFRADPAGVAAQPPGRSAPRPARRYPPDAWPACARKLQLAAEWMDEAAVSTIHGWCNRMLREHAFDSDSLFTQRSKPTRTSCLPSGARLLAQLHVPWAATTPAG
jgi:exodeoxyribonuclease V beta subunit